MRSLTAILAAIVAALVAIALSFTTVKGAGVNLSWDDCGAHGVQLRAFACNTNVGSNTLVGSFVAPVGIVAMSANEIVMDLESADVSLPNWWGMRTGLCRPLSLTSSFDFSTGPFNCYDYWQAGAIGAIVMDPPVGNRVRIKGICALPAGDSRITAVPEGLEVYSFKAIINNAKTTGLGACGGCITPACIVLQSIRLNQPAPNVSFLIGNPAERASVGWQCGGQAVDWPQLCFFAGCPTPTRAQTWGQIKQLYR